MNKWWLGLSNLQRLSIVLGILFSPILLCFAMVGFIGIITPETPATTQEVLSANTQTTPSANSEITPTAIVTASTTAPTSSPSPSPLPVTSTPIPTATQAPKPIVTSRPVATSTPSPAPIVTQAISPYTCNCKKTCTQITSCAEAYFQLNTCGCQQRDADKDGIPCEDLCG